MEKTTLKNGITLITEKRSTKSVTIQVMVKAGSNYENEKIAGISHFMEHMLFEGTKNRTAIEIANEIESLGGEINAATSNERTVYYITVLKKYFNTAVEVLADMIQNPLFDEKALEKERGVVLDEVNMVVDDPKRYQWVLFQKTLYKKHPAKNPIYGTAQAIKTITRQDLLDYYEKHYKPNNIIITVVGNLKEAKEKIEQKFTFQPKETGKREKIDEPQLERTETFVEPREILQSYMMMGYKTVPRTHEDSYIIDVIRAILGRGQSSRLFDEIRVKRGLAYSLGVVHATETDYGWLAVYVGTDKRNIETVKEIILNEVSKLKKVSSNEIKDAKKFIEGNYYLENEDNHSMADNLASWELVGDLEGAEEYVKRTKKVTKQDIKRVIEKYMKNYVYVGIEQK
ncbi:MAG: pitrilysin family protein [archaeon]